MFGIMKYVIIAMFKSHIQPSKDIYTSLEVYHISNGSYQNA